MTNDSAKPIKQADSDRPKPINDARLAALEELSALDQKLELEYGLTGNPLIKAGRHTPQPQTTPGECSRPREGTSEPVAWWVRGCEYDTGCEYEFVALLKEQAELAATNGGKALPLYRSPTLTDAEREAVDTAEASLLRESTDLNTPLPVRQRLGAAAATLRGLLERLK